MLHVSVLPCEVLSHVFSFCDPEDLGRVAQVCAYWRELVSDKLVQRPTARRWFGVTVHNGGAPFLYPAAVQWKSVNGADERPLPLLDLSVSRAHAVTAPSPKGEGF